MQSATQIFAEEDLPLNNKKKKKKKKKYYRVPKGIEGSHLLLVYHDAFFVCTYKIA